MRKVYLNARGVVPLLAGAALLAMVACSSTIETSGVPLESTDTTLSTPAPEIADTSVVPMTTKEAARRFLDIVCPTDFALHVLENASLAEGGWKPVKPKAVQPLTRTAVEAAGTASQGLDRDDWPEAVAEVMPLVRSEYLELLGPLNQIDQASSGAGMQGPWKQIQSLPRTAEQQVRLSLGLPTAGAKDDGCPPAPRVSSPKPKPQSSSVTPAVPAVPSDYRTRLCTTSAGNLPAVTSGESSQNVRLLQWALRQLGYYRGDIGGNYGSQTYEATVAFQYANGLGQTAPGSVAVNTWTRLQSYLC